MAVEKYLIALMLVGIVDSISYMVVAPSIVFYVLENGGTKEQYGLILSAFSFSSFLAKPFVGYWSDKYGFRVPYMVTLVVSTLGGFVYLIAGAFVNPSTSVGLILAARLMGGVGAANAALGFAYLAKVVPHEDQTKTNSLLSMMRIFGMAMGPGFNIFLASIDTDWFGLHVTDLNSVGLVLMASNIISLVVIYMLLQEPEEHEHVNPEPEDESSLKDHSVWATTKALCSFKLLLPIFAIFSLNINFQLIDTGLAPAANHALGWTPVTISSILGSMSIIIFCNMVIVFSLSARKVKDELIVMFGAAVSMVGYFLVWDLWRWESAAWNFYVPIILGTSGFPFLAAPVRSLFTKAVDSIDILAENQGSMQALLSMFASFAGFTAPGLIAAYVLQNPDEVENSKHHRELSPYALVAPLVMALVLVGVIVMYCQGTLEGNDDDDAAANEETGLLSSDNSAEQRCSKIRRFSSKCEVDRRTSTALMGMVQQSMYDEHPSLYEDDE